MLRTLSCSTAGQAVFLSKQSLFSSFVLVLHGIFSSCLRLEASPTLRTSLKDILCGDNLMENLERPQSGSW